MTKIQDDVLKKIAKDIEKILLKNEMALQPYMERNAYGSFAAVRLVSTKEPVAEVTPEVPVNPPIDVEQATDSGEAGTN